MMNNVLIGSMLTIALLFAGCVQKKSEETKDAVQETQASTVATDPVKQDVIPAMLVQSIKMELQQPRICHPDEELEGTVCTNSEVISLTSNIEWIDQIIDQEIKDEFSENLVVASPEQKKLNQTDVEYPRNWSKSSSYQFNGQFGQYVQIAKTHAEYLGGAHGMAYFTSYVFDLKNKKRMTLNDIVITGKQDALKARLWQAYENWCDDHDMEPFINKEDFYISENFSIKQSGGLAFDYQLYELAPYVAGPVSLDVYDTKGLIKTDFIAEALNFEQEY